MSIHEIMAEKEGGDFTHYFEERGFKVLWDFDSKAEWWEICDKKDGIICQVETKAGLDEFIQDLKHIANGTHKNGIEKWCNILYDFQS
jgi:hypothetical protein